MATMTTPQTAGDLAARLLLLSQQKAGIEREIAALKDELETLYASDGIAAKNDTEILFSDGTVRTVRLQRKKTGTYFKVQSEYKDEFSGEKHKLEQRFLKAGKAEMAEKSPTWVAQEVK